MKLEDGLQDSTAETQASILPRSCRLEGGWTVYSREGTGTNCFVWLARSRRISGEGVVTDTSLWRHQTFDIRVEDS